MEFSKKLVLVPEDRVQMVEHLSELDQRMQNILRSKNLSEDEKATLYLQILQKYTHFSIERTTPESVPEPEITTEEEEAEPIVKTEQDEFEEKVVSAAPVQYKDTAKDIFQFLKSQNSLKWNNKGEIVYQEELVPRTNIVDLVSDLLRNRKKAPVGRNVFLNALRDIKFPVHFDVSEKLNKSVKIVKRKPTMYARKRTWIKM
jgi:hypothetical protein